MTNTEKRLEELKGWSNGLRLKKGQELYDPEKIISFVESFLAESIHQAIAEERERVRERVGELTIYRNNKGVTEIEENTGYYKANEITSSLDKTDK